MASNKSDIEYGRARNGERGYILITAVWILLLGASIVAVIMIHNISASKEASFERKLTGIRNAQESAIDTVIADILFNGPRSSFAQLPATASYNIGGEDVQVEVSSESGKIDLNQADPNLIERALRGLAIPGVERQTFLRSIARRRGADALFQSLTDVEAEMMEAGIAVGSDFCASRYFTVYSGLEQPLVSQMDPELAKALGLASVSASSGNARGAALRILVETEMATPLTAVVRTSGLIGQSHSVLDWNVGSVC